MSGAKYQLISTHGAHQREVLEIFQHDLWLENPELYFEARQGRIPLKEAYAKLGITQATFGDQEIIAVSLQQFRFFRNQWRRTYGKPEASDKQTLKYLFGRFEWAFKSQLLSEDPEKRRRVCSTGSVETHPRAEYSGFLPWDSLPTAPDQKVIFARLVGLITVENRRSYSPEERLELWRLFKGICALCKDPEQLMLLAGDPNDSRAMDVHHFWPVSLEGPIDPDNEVPAHHFCNMQASNKSPRQQLLMMTRGEFGLEQTTIVGRVAPVEGQGKGEGHNTLTITPGAGIVLAPKRTPVLVDVNGKPYIKHD